MDAISQTDGTDLVTDDYNELMHTAYTQWHLIVVTAMDDAQKDAYEQLIDDHITRWRKQFGDVENKFIVIADPPGRKVGNGGSTIHVLRTLHKTHGEALFEKKLLLIQAGGYSQRMPSSSALGKLFIVFPSHNDQVRSMLEVKLLLSAAFVRDAPSGVLLMCADDIEVYDFSMRVPRDFFSATGFTAIGHPISDLDVASKHGVYVIDEQTYRTSDVGNLSTADCVRVLQKPSESKMRESGAILHDQSVFIDSFFFFVHAISQVLLRIGDEYESQCDDAQALSTCEIDAYADFLQALGAKASRDYVERAATSNFQARFRGALFDALHDCELKLLIIPNSAFFHVGTNGEYLEHLCAPRSQFFNALRLASQSRAVVRCGSGETATDCDQHQATSLCSCLLRSSRDCELGKPTIVEFCSVTARSIRIGARCIVSNVQFDAPDSDFIVPDGMFAQTVSVQTVDQGEPCYVTLFCSVSDDLKAAVVPNNDEDVEEALRRVAFCGAPLAKFISAMRMGVGDVFQDVTNNRHELWRARLFPIAASATEAFTSAARLMRVACAAQEAEEALTEKYSNVRRVSISEALRCKSLQTIISYRTQLLESLAAPATARASSD